MNGQLTENHAPAADFSRPFFGNFDSGQVKSLFERVV
jgi:hypothetical protein